MFPSPPLGVTGSTQASGTRLRVLSSAAFGMPAAASGASLANPSNMQGAVAGMTSAAMGSGLLVAPVIAMFIYGYSAPGAFVGIATAVAAASFLLLPRMSRRLAVTQPSSHAVRFDETLQN